MTGSILDDSLQPVVDAGLVDLVPCDHRITSHLRFEDTRGHTPAHAAVRVTDPTGATPGAVLSGDLMHSPLQLVLPDLEVVYDVDRRQGVQARHDFVDRYADSGVLVLAAHFGGDGAGFIRRDGQGCPLRPRPAAVAGAAGWPGGLNLSRGGEIRTPDHVLPKHVRYQAALLPEDRQA